MAVITDIAALSTNPALNGPDGSVDPPSTLDDQLRYHGSFIAKVRDGAGIPVGVIVACAGPNPPLGFVLMNGVLLSRTTYANLFAYATAAGLVTEAAWSGGSWGCFSVGDGSTTFRVPDVRGMFIRALDLARGVDPSRALGVDQAGANAAHSHGVNDPSHAHGVADPGHSHGAWTDAQGQHTHGFTIGSYGGGANGAASMLSPLAGIQTDAAGSHSHNVGVSASGTGISIYGAGTGISIQTSGGSEARPRNLAYPHCIKY